MSSVRLVNSMAGDAFVVDAARISLARTREEEGLSDRDRGLINFLMEKRHGTPFEHAVFTFHVECPIFVAREWMRHRIGSFNEQSARYSELPREFFEPEQWRTQVGKPGAYSYEGIHDPQKIRAAEIAWADAMITAAEAYDDLLELGVARELASRVLPVATMTQFYWTVNARAMMNFLSLRNAPDAQQEIRELAQKVEAEFALTMPVTHTAFVKHGRRSP